LFFSVRRRCPGKNQSAGEEAELKVHICSENNFPTAAGLASSAAGYACMGVYKCLRSVVACVCSYLCVVPAYFDWGI